MLIAIVFLGCLWGDAILIAFEKSAFRIDSKIGKMVLAKFLKLTVSLTLHRNYANNNVQFNLI